MFICIKDVFSESVGELLFKEGQTYHSQELGEITGHKVIDETESLHIIGRSGEEWFDRYFRDSTDEECMEPMDESYSELSNHEGIDAEILQESIIKQTVDVQYHTMKSFLSMLKNHTDKD